jgi:hypothetical protein
MKSKYLVVMLLREAQGALSVFKDSGSPDTKAAIANAVAAIENVELTLTKEWGS